jgi:branched-chain amino acid transport system ATP-binding protein
MSILETKNMTMRFGGVVAVNELNIQINKNETIALIGPNGAGKTTAFNMITGVYTPTSGDILLNNNLITGLNSSKVAKLGIARTFQNIRLFKDLTVFENIIIAKHLHLKSNFLQATFRFPNSKYSIEEKKMIEECDVLLEKVGLMDLKNEKSSSLPYGKQRRLEIVRGLATNPQVLLLDEPAAGMNPSETLDLINFIKLIKKDYNLTIFTIEHHMELVMEISDLIYVLNFGNLIAKGTPEEIQNNQIVIDAYLGVDD